MKLKFLFSLMLIFAVPVNAVEIGEKLSDSGLEERARRLSEEIKCPVCAGQSIDDSNVDLAKTLRAWIRQQIILGKTDHEIRLSLVDTFGESILFRPIINVQNIILWAAPFLIFLFLIIKFIQHFRKENSRI